MKTVNHCYSNTLRTLGLIAACCAFVSCQLSTSENRAAQAVKSTSHANAININTASAEELEKIPYVGGKIAGRIIAYRNVNGPFRRVEHLMLVDGISDQRFRQIREFVRVE